MGSNQPSCQKASQSGKIIMGTQALPSISLFPPRSMQDTCFPAALNRHGVAEWKREPHTLSPFALRVVHYLWRLVQPGWSGVPVARKLEIISILPRYLSTCYGIQQSIRVDRNSPHSVQYENGVWSGNRARDRNTNDTI